MRFRIVKDAVLWAAAWIFRFIQWSGDLLHAKQIAVWLWERFGHLAYRGFAPAWLTTIGLAAAGVIPVIVLIIIAFAMAYWLGLQIDRNEKLMSENREWLEAMDERIQQQVQRIVDVERRLPGFEAVAEVVKMLQDAAEERGQQGE